MARAGLFAWPAEEPFLIGHRCRSCRRVYFPKRFICPECFEKNTLEEVPLSRKGRLYTFCLVERGPLGFSTPYAVGYIDLPEGLRIFSPLAETRLEKLRIGMEMELAIEKIRQDDQGNAVLGYRFKPTEEGP